MLKFPRLLASPLLLITTLAAALRLPTLGLESFWYDETFTAWLTQLPISNLLAATLGDVHPPTWYLIEWGVAHTLGTSEFNLRLVSALAGIALVPAVYRLTLNVRTLNVERSNAPTVAALITALAPFGIYYSQEARPYSLLMLACTLATIGLLERRWWLLVLCSSFALYLHNLAFLYICGLVWLGLYRRLEWRMAASFLAIGMIWSPWLIFGLLGQAADVQNGFWVRPPNAGTPAYILSNLFFMESGFIAVNTGLMAGLLLAQVDWRKQLELTGLVIVCLGLGVILSVLIAPVLIIRVMAPLAPVLYALVAPVLTFQRSTFNVQRSNVQRWILPALALVTALTWFAAYTLSDNVGRPPALQNLQPLISNLQPGDGLYHGNLASYITMHYYLPGVPQTVWKQANDLSQSLTGETKAAMGMNQAHWGMAKCNHPRWWIITASNPTTSARERDYLTNLLATYHGVQRAVIQHGPLVDARLWLVDTRPYCPQFAEAAR